MDANRVFKEYSTVENVMYATRNSVVERIEYHEPQGEGDAHYCDVVFKNGNTKRIFRPDEIDF